MVRNNLVLPVIHHAVSFILLASIVLILYVHSCIIVEVSNFEFAIFLGETLLRVTILIVIFLVNNSLLPLNKVINRLLFFDP